MREGMKEGNEEARQTEGDNGQGDRERKARRVRVKLADREGRAARERRTEEGKGNGERREGGRLAGEGIEGCTTEKEGGRKERG